MPDGLAMPIAVTDAAIDDLYAAIGKRIRTARLRGGYTQVQLGRAVGLSRVSVTNIERGFQRPPLHVLISIAQALDVDAAGLLGIGEDLPVLAPAMPPAAARLRRHLTTVREQIDALLALLPEPDLDAAPRTNGASEPPEK
jgi:Predicted transcriptional regulators